MKTINLIIGILGLLIVIINYTIIPKEIRFGKNTTIFNIVFGIANLIFATV